MGKTYCAMKLGRLDVTKAQRRIGLSTACVQQVADMALERIEARLAELANVNTQGRSPLSRSVSTATKTESNRRDLRTNADVPRNDENARKALSKQRLRRCRWNRGRGPRATMERSLGAANSLHRMSTGNSEAIVPFPG